MTRRRHDLILAFYPNARGFAFVLFEQPCLPVDWGISEVTYAEDRTATCLRRLSALIDRYGPKALVMRDCKGSDATQLASLTEALEMLGRRRGIATHRISRAQVRQSFAELPSPTRYAIAETIAKRVPTFAYYLPPPRKIWNGEDRRMGLFDAAALALAFSQATL